MDVSSSAFDLLITFIVRLKNVMWCNSPKMYQYTTVQMFGVGKIFKMFLSHMLTQATFIW